MEISCLQLKYISDLQNDTWTVYVGDQSECAHEGEHEKSFETNNFIAHEDLLLLGYRP